MLSTRFYNRLFVNMFNRSVWHFCCSNVIQMSTDEPVHFADTIFRLKIIFQFQKCLIFIMVCFLSVYQEKVLIVDAKFLVVVQNDTGTGHMKI